MIYKTYQSYAFFWLNQQKRSAISFYGLIKMTQNIPEDNTFTPSMGNNLIFSELIWLRRVTHSDVWLSHGCASKKPRLLVKQQTFFISEGVIKNACAILINANYFKEHTAVNKLHRSSQKATAGSFNLKTTYMSRNAAFFSHHVSFWRVTDWKMEA